MFLLPTLQAEKRYFQPEDLHLMTNQPEKTNVEFEKSFKIKFGAFIKAKREQIGLTRNAAAALLDVSNSTLQAWELGERSPNAYNIDCISTLYKVTVSELFEAKDQSSLPASYLKPCSDVADVLGDPVNVDDFYFVPRYNIKASAGGGAAIGNESPMHQMSFRKYWVDNILHVNPKGLAVIGVRGDSMSPEINEKDVLLINTHDTALRHGIYVLRIHEDLIVKRVQMLFNNNIEIVSTNPVYRPIELNINDLPSDFAIIGRVLWFGRTMPQN